MGAWPELAEFDDLSGVERPENIVVLFNACLSSEPGGFAKLNAELWPVPVAGLFKVKADPALAVPPKTFPLLVPPRPKADNDCEGPAVAPKLPKGFALEAAGVLPPDPNRPPEVFLLSEVDCPKIPDPPLVGVLPKEKAGVDFGGSDMIGDTPDEGRKSSVEEGLSPSFSNTYPLDLCILASDVTRFAAKMWWIWRYIPHVHTQAAKRLG